MGLPAPDPQRFVAIIPAADAPRFDPPPDAAYNGRLVKVWGTIKKRGAVATIVVTRPAQIVVEQ